MDHHLPRTAIRGLRLTGLAAVFGTVVLLAAGCTAPSASNTHQPLSATASPTIPPVSTSSSATPATSTITVASTSLPNASNATSSGWSTYTAPSGLYSIQYPTSFGQLTVRPDQDTAPNINAVDLTWSPSGDASALLVYISLDYYNMKHRAGLTLQDTLVANGLITKIYSDGYGNERAFVTKSNSTGPVFYIDFTCNSVAGSYDCSLPSEWRQMLSTFRLFADDQ
jgi:hypothetical protein